MRLHREMTCRHLCRSIVMLIAVLSGPALHAQEQPAARGAAGDWTAVDRMLGRKGTPQPGGVMKYSFPRSDLRVTVGGVTLAPALALGSWVAFMRAGGDALAMGDLVLTEDEVGPVMQRLQQGGVEQTALHNHVLGESPRVMYMHIHAKGDATKIAQAIRAALGASKTPLAAPAGGGGRGGDAMPVFDLDTTQIARALGRAGKVTGGVYQVSVPRAERITEHGVEIPPAMGVATAINFQPTGSGKAAITGDFVMTPGEVNPVIHALREHGIAVTALHSHLLDETPHLFFMHFWANGDAVTLARGLRAALDRMHTASAAAR